MDHYLLVLARGGLRNLLKFAYITYVTNLRNIRHLVLFPSPVVKDTSLTIYIEYRNPINENT